MCYSKKYLKSIKITNYRSSPDQPGAYDVIFSITSTTTPEYFDKIIMENKMYKLHYGGRFGYTALQIALEDGNKILAKHIANIGKEKVVNLVGGRGILPLFQIGDDIDLLKNFIENRADINIAVKYHINNIVTPISRAIKNKNFHVAEYMYINGAILN